MAGFLFGRNLLSAKLTFGWMCWEEEGWKFFTGDEVRFGIARGAE